MPTSKAITVFLRPCSHEIDRHTSEYRSGINPSSCPSTVQWPCQVRHRSPASDWWSSDDVRAVL
eukprot:1695594-Amphidinium_carterae.2